MEDNNVTNEKNIKTHKQKKEKCYYDGCNKKLKMVDLKCQCEHRFCSLHRLPECHNCNFDFKTKGRDNLKKTLETKLKKTNIHIQGSGGVY